MQRKYSAPTAPSAAADSVDMVNLQISVRCTHSLEEIWQALVDPAKLARWMRPISGSLAMGGTINLGQDASATITACEPKRRLALSLAQGELMQGVAVTLGEEGKGKSKQRLLRLNVSATRAGMPQEAWASFGPAALGIAWELTCKALIAYLDAPEAKVDFVTYARSTDAADYVASAFADWRAQALVHHKDAGFMPEAKHLPFVFYNGLHN